jgi:acetolactate synthase regulatory subunit
MQHRLSIQMQNNEGALVRLLGLIQRRGFTVEDINMPNTSGNVKSVSLAVSPDHDGRSIDVLQKQITRLYDVDAVTIDGPTVEADFTADKTVESDRARIKIPTGALPSFQNKAGVIAGLRK